MATGRAERVALVYRGDQAARTSAVIENSRLAPVAEALRRVGLTPEPAVYAESVAEEFRRQLHEVRAVLVWVDPVTGSEDRSRLDGILREVAAAGVWVSAHPDAILKMGTKEVLHRTRELGWGSDTYLYSSPEEFEATFPVRLAAGEARVIKQYRGNGGIGVWKVQLAARPGSVPGREALVRVQSARARDDTVEEVSLGSFMDRCAKYFGYSDGQGRLIDQAFQARITEGLIRCYLVGEAVVGFSRQYPTGRSPGELAAGGATAVPPERVFGLPAAKTMYGPEEAGFANLRRFMEDEWVPGLLSLVELDAACLPVLWDADFLLGPKTGAGQDTYVLSEINVSAVAPFPDQALPRLAAAVLARTVAGA